MAADSACEAGFRLFKHEKLLGEPVCIPENPQRIVTLGAFSVETMLAMGIEPVGAQGRHIEDRSRDFPETAPLFANTTDIGNPPNPESILALDPDLIIGVDAVVEEVIEELPVIAPTVLFDFETSAEWKEATRFFADAVGQSEAGEQLFADYDAKIAALQDALAADENDPTVSILRVRPDRIQIYLPGSFPGTVVSDIGLRRPENQDIEGFTTNISMEELPSADADVMLLWTFGANAEIRGQNSDALSALLDEALWQSLDVVQNEQVYEFPGYWIGSGALAANAIVDDISTALAGETFDVATAPAAASDECGEGQRLFDHELLFTDPVCISVNPEKIIALDVASVELALMTGKELQATSGWILDEMPRMLPQYAEALTPVEDVGYPANLEMVLRLKPDIILAVGGTNVGDTIDIDQALEIAPVVIADPLIYEDWKRGTEFWSAVLNVSDFYAEMEENYFTRIGELQAALGGEPGELEVSVASVGSTAIYLWMPDTPPGNILRDVGLARPESQAMTIDESMAAYEAAQYVQISEERLDLLDGDAIFYFGREQEYIDEFTEGPLWQALGATEAEGDFFVPEHWWRSQTYLLANLVIDDLFAYLTDTEATTPIVATE
ncbi:MAG: ABC transporter substrate-binding protein [Chloroflexota bacterium]